MSASPITNVFVLMLENRSFDSMLGFSGIRGTDAVTGEPTAIDGLSGTESNTYDGTVYTVTRGGYANMPVDPGHEFPDTVWQLAGGGVEYPRGGPYPPIDGSGFVYDYVNSPSAEEGGAKSDFGAIMRGFAPDQLPVLTTLATSFAVCDNWFSSLPGPTWPNRFFVHGASSGGLDTSPTTLQMAGWESAGLALPNGSIFDRLDATPPLNQLGWRVFSDAGATGTISTALAGVSHFDVEDIDTFCTRVQYPVYPWAYTFLEPDYGDAVNGTFLGGSSQHPQDTVTAGEALIKKVYEAIRSAPCWETSVLIVTYDEHGGFYDHVAPPSAPAPGDNTGPLGLNTYGFDFTRYGVRVPAVVISPRIPAGVIDKRLYDHGSIPKALFSAFGLAGGHLTDRDLTANDPLALLTLDAPRTDTPVVLPDPVAVAAGPVVTAASADLDRPMPASQRGFVLLAAKVDMELSGPQAEPAVRARVAAVRTVREAGSYIAEVEARAQAAKAARRQAARAPKR